MLAAAKMSVPARLSHIIVVSMKSGKSLLLARVPATI
jgi:hypothetical protein